MSITGIYRAFLRLYTGCMFYLFILIAAYFTYDAFKGEEALKAQPKSKKKSPKSYTPKKRQRKETAYISLHKRVVVEKRPVW
jgi:hypothetical protein